MYFFFIFPLLQREFWLCDKANFDPHDPQVLPPSSSGSWGSKYKGNLLLNILFFILYKFIKIINNLYIYFSIKINI